MRRLLVFLAACSGGSNQAMENDAKLDRLRAALPTGWTMTRKSDRLALERGEKAWVLHENRINAPLDRETPEERSARIRKHGKPATCRFVFRLEAAWPAEKIRRATDANRALDEEIAGLPEKHGIAHLRNDRLSRKGGDVFTPTNAEEEKKVAAYMADRGAVEKKRVALPDYQSETSALFLVEREGMEDERTIVDPPAASQEMFGIQRSLQELLGI